MDAITVIAVVVLYLLAVGGPWVIYRYAMRQLRKVYPDADV